MGVDNISHFQLLADYTLERERKMSIHELPAAVMEEIEPNLYLQAFLEKGVRADGSSCRAYRPTRVTRGTLSSFEGIHCCSFCDGGSWRYKDDLWHATRNHGADRGFTGRGSDWYRSFRVETASFD